MRRSSLVRRLAATVLPAALCMGLPGTMAVAEPLQGRSMSSFGLPGGIDAPTAEMLPEGTLGATISFSGYGRRSSMVFQVLPRVTTVLRYSRVNGVREFANEDAITDRSLDLRMQLLDEDGWRPAVAVGLQDFLGTGVYSGEYIVATKTVTPRVRATAGLGWGVLAGRPRLIDVNNQGGTLNAREWFRGGAKPFASVGWQVNDRLDVVAEWSNNDQIARYNTGQVFQQGKAPESNLNLAAFYRFGENYQAGLYTIGGNTVGAQFSLLLNPRQSPYPSGLAKAPAPVRPRPAPAADPDGWSGVWAGDPTAQPAIQTALGDAMADEGQVLEAMALTATRAEVRVDNTRFVSQAEAVGRTARLMTRALPPSVETFVITSTAQGIPTGSVTLRRSDVERLENTEAGRIAAVSALGDAPARVPGLVYGDGVYPRFRWSVRPFLSLGFFSASEGLTYEGGGQARATYTIAPGLILSGAVRQRVLGNIERRGPAVPGQRGRRYSFDEYRSNPALETTPDGVPRVRSDTRMYSGNDKPTISDLTLAWYAKPAPAVYTRVTAGILERAFAGISTEALWKPANSPLALGVEVNRVRKREFNQLLAFRDYEVTMGHVSAYYEFPQGFTAQLDVGKYLAGDKGATLTVTREFANGWRIGAFATKTNLSAEEFGEGSFDKGVTLSIPLGWATGQPTQDRVGSRLRSLSRDGGAQLSVNGRLYDTVRESHSAKLYEGWGRFWR